MPPVLPSHSSQLWRASCWSSDCSSPFRWRSAGLPVSSTGTGLARFGAWRCSQSAWVVLATVGVGLAPGVPLASWSTAALASEQGAKAVADLRDHGAFAKDIAMDRFTHASGPELLQALRGKDVLVVFVESYGRVAVDESSLVDATLESSTNQLRAEGFSSRSAWLTSSAFGGFSWLAHCQPSLGPLGQQPAAPRPAHVDRPPHSEPRLRKRRVADRRGRPGEPLRLARGVVLLRLRHRLRRAHPGLCRSGIWATPRCRTSTPSRPSTASSSRRPHRRPVMAEVDLVTSHVPVGAAPAARRLGLDRRRLGLLVDGGQGAYPGHRVADQAKGVRAAYAQSIAYSLDSLVSFLQQHARRQPRGAHARRPPADHHGLRRRREPRRAGQPHQPGTAPSWTVSPVGAGATACGRRPRLRCGAWTSSATAS